MYIYYFKSKLSFLIDLNQFASNEEQKIIVKVESM
ncbi:hypothetical protein SAMN04487887_11725 [Enterococcus casseliflavus]|nr:hypothetical protein SAMN04487887_11725 [Enterococcus casseliflavus]